MRRRNTLVDATQAAMFDNMEFVLLRCPKFFAKENVATVFPDAAHIADLLKETVEGTIVVPHDVNYYLLYTFQPCDFVMERSSDEESEVQGLSTCDEGVGASPAITLASASAAVNRGEEEEGEGEGHDEAKEGSAVGCSATPAMEWKDLSRERVYQFMTDAKHRVTEYLHNPAEDDTVPSFFMDWPDPATGLPAFSARGATVFSDADTVEQFFPFKKVMVAGPGGGCYMVEHPRFGVNVYLDAAVLVVPHELEERLCEAVRSLGV